MEVGEEYDGPMRDQQEERSLGMKVRKKLFTVEFQWASSTSTIISSDWIKIMKTTESITSCNYN
jgi:hypothetical protein